MEDLVIDDIKKDEPIYDIWAKRNPRFEKKFKDSVIKYTCDFMKGTNATSDARNKVLGAGYESYIMAFFIGLYSNKRKKLSEDAEDLDNFHWPIQHWGNIEQRFPRHPYPSLRLYMFIAVVARTNLDWIALEKGEMDTSLAVSALIRTMEEYANYGYMVMEEKIKEDPMYFFDNYSYLNLFKDIIEPEAHTITNELEPESLD